MNANLAAKKDAIEGFLREIIMHNQARVIAVLESFGIYEYPSPEVVVNAYRMYGNEFLKHFHEIYVTSNELAKADGSVYGPFQTAEEYETSGWGGQQSNKKSGSFSFDELGNVFSGASSVWEQLNISLGKTGSSTPAPAEPSNTPTIPYTNLKMTNPLVIVGGILVFLVVLLVLVKMLKKK